MDIKDKQPKLEENNQAENNVTIFYSWQSDNKKSKNYIENELKKSVEYINSNNSNIATIIDRDTKNKIGSPNIPLTIEDKIKNCDIFIADLSIVGENNGKKQINQNVMYEIGYAMAKKGDAYCILLQNSDECSPKDLPFDISQRRLLIYSGKTKDLKRRLLEVLPLYIENSHLVKNQIKDSEILNGWSKEILNLFASISGEKRIVLSKAGRIALGIQGSYNQQIGNIFYTYHDPQEIRASFTELVENRYLEISYTANGSPIYKLLQKGYDYINKNKITNLAPIQSRNNIAALSF